MDIIQSTLVCSHCLPSIFLGICSPVHPSP